MNLDDSYNELSLLLNNYADLEQNSYKIIFHELSNNGIYLNFNFIDFATFLIPLNQVSWYHLLEHSFKIADNSINQLRNGNTNFLITLFNDDIYEFSLLINNEEIIYLETTTVNKMNRIFPMDIIKTIKNKYNKKFALKIKLIKKGNLRELAEQSDYIFDSDKYYSNVLFQKYLLDFNKYSKLSHNLMLSEERLKFFDVKEHIHYINPLNYGLVDISEIRHFFESFWLTNFQNNTIITFSKNAFHFYEQNHELVINMIKSQTLPFIIDPNEISLIDKILFKIKYF